MGIKRRVCALFSVGDRYIVADCGGGTVDLTVHQIEQPQGTLKELYKASGTRIFQKLLARQKQPAALGVLQTLSFSFQAAHTGPSG